MKIIRNPEFKRELLVYAVLTLAVALIGFFIRPICGALALVAGALFCAAHLYFAHKRYRGMEELAQKLNRILHGQDKLLIEESAEGVAESAVWQELGWAEIGSENEYKPYLLVEAADEDIENLLSFRLLSGRMPENDSELLLPAHLASNGNVLYREGDTLTVSLGRRVDADGETLPATVSFDPEGGEQITDTVERSFTVVGTYERLDILVENYSCPGYTALTRSDGRGEFTVFLRLRHPGQLQKWMEAHPGVGRRVIHEDLRRFNGVFNTESYNVLLYGFAGVLVFLISFGSISLIYNSFSISVSERTRQFGILKSVGATKKQIRASVLYEALLLSAIGIPLGLIVGCVGIGLTLYFLRDAFAGLLFTGANTQMRLVLHPLALLFAAAVCLVTTLISAAIPARRAIRISPIDSIRQSDDVKLKSREVRTSRLTQKLFGFEGTMAAKNFKRNRRRCRSMVVSLFLSVSLFISASSFCAYLTDAVNGFIILISLIAVANVFNTISTNILLRRREFAMLRSIGLGNIGFRKMMNYECIIYGLKGLAWGLPAAFGMTWVIWRITNTAFDRGFYIPWASIVIAVGSVFLVVFVTMLYATDKLKTDNTIDALKNENL